MKRLYNIDNISDFILAVAGGADINAIYKGMPLIKYYFLECMRHISYIMNGEDKNLEKFKVLIAGGADIEPLFKELQPSFCNPGNNYMYDGLVDSIGNLLTLIDILISSGEAGEKITEYPEYQDDFKTLLITLKLSEEATDRYTLTDIIK